LGVRDRLGLSKAAVSLLTKSWDGKKPGEGSCTESRMEMHPSPTIKDYGHDLRIVEAGAIRQGDLLLKHLDRKLTREQILNQTDRASVESYWEIDGRLYKAVKEKDEIFYWSVQVRPTSGG
jgi:hypothetical protein